MKMTGTVNTILNRLSTLLKAVISAGAGTHSEIEALNSSNIIIGRIAFNPKKYYYGKGILISPENETLMPEYLRKREDQLTIRFEVVTGENLTNPIVQCTDLVEDLKQFILEYETVHDASGNFLCQRYTDTIDVQYYVVESGEGNVMVAVLTTTYNWSEDIG